MTAPVTASRRVRARVVCATAVTALVGGLASVVLAAAPASATSYPGPGPVMQPSASMPTADALPTTQIDGVAWKQVVVGNTVYVGGDFANARPAGSAPGVNTTPRTDLLAYDITTGNLITTFAPTLNGQVLDLAVSPDGTKLYAVGDFTTVNGVSHQRIAAFDAVTGALIPTFTASLNNTAKAVAASNTNVYAGGLFTQANSVGRTRLAAFDTTGALTAWAPTADLNVNSMVLNQSQSQVDIAGAFTNINSQPVYGIGAVDATTGATVPFAVNQTLQAYTANAAFLDLSISGNTVYGSAYNYHATVGNTEGAFSADATSGAINWVEDCHGDTYGVYATPYAAYTVGHAHYCLDNGGSPNYDVRQYRHSIAFSLNATGTALHDTDNYSDHFGTPSPSIYNWFPDFTTGTYTGQNQAAWNVTGNASYVVEGGEFPTVNGTAQQGLVRFAARPTAPGASGPQESGAHMSPELTVRSANSVRIAFQTNWDRDDMALTYKIVRNSDTAHPIWSGTVNSEWWNRPMVGYVDTGLVAGRAYKYRVYVNDPDGNTVASPNVTITPSATSTLSAYDNQVIADGATNYWPLDESSGAVAYDYAGADDLDVNPGVSRGTSGPITGETASTFSGDSTGLAGDRAPSAAPTAVTVSAWVRTTSTSGGRIVGFGNNPVGLSSTDDRHLYLDNSGRAYFGVTSDSSNGLKLTNNVVSSQSPVNDGQWHQLVGTLGPNSMTLSVDGNVVAQRSDVAASTPVYNGWWRIGGDELTGWANAPSSDYLAGDIASVAVFNSAVPQATVQREYSSSGRTFAGFSSSVSGTTVNFDASASSSSGQNVASYSWDFGDGTTGSGATPSHVYSGSQPYTVKLTVTDAVGNPFTVTHQVLPWSSQALVSDSFNRVGSGGFGTAELGGAWTVTGDTSRLSTVSGAALSAVYAGGSGQNEEYAGPTTTGADVRTDFSLDKVPGTGFVQQIVVLRRISAGNFYAAKVNVNPTGGVTVRVVKQVGGVETALDGPVTVSGITYTPGMSLSIRAQAFNSSPTTVRARVWKTNGAEPSAWKVTGTDSTASLQQAGVTGLSSFGQSTLANAPVTVRTTAFQTLSLASSGAVPTATFSHAETGLTSAFNASASTPSTPGGSITGYAWTFGDGSTGTGVTPTHPYAAAGTYPVTLTVTDNTGATGSVTNNVVVNAVLASDAFGRTVASGFGTADTGGAWTLNGTADRFAVNGSQGQITLSTRGAGPTASLASVSAADVDITTDVSLAQASTGSATYATVAARQNGAGEYRMKVKYLSTGKIALYVSKVVGGTETTVATQSISGLTVAPGSVLRLEAVVTGSSPTTIKMRAWAAGGTVPAYQLITTDSSLSAAGGVGVGTYFGSQETGTNTVTFDNFQATTP